MLLYKPFYEPLQAQLRDYGGLLRYTQLYLSKNATDDMNLFHIPSVTELISILAKEKSFPAQAVVDVVFPFLLSVGAILATFLGTHIKYILTARTTLEHRVILEHQIASLTASSSSKLVASMEKHHVDNWVNPFDQGFYLNWVQVMGSNWLYLFLPIPVAPPPPYLPEQLKKKNR
jgi:hypothetical protein